jgi:hypothetical protein
MPILERKPEHAFRRFHKHVNKLVTATIPVPSPARLAWTSKGGQLATMEFVRGDGIGTALPLSTRFGPLYLTLLQVLETERELTHYRLKTTPACDGELFAAQDLLVGDHARRTYFSPI